MRIQKDLRMDLEVNERTIIRAEMNEVRRVLYAEAEDRLLPQYVAGLEGLPGD